MALPALPSNPASSLPSDLNDDNDHFAHYCMNISLPMRILWICKALQLHYLSGILAGLPTALG